MMNSEPKIIVALDVESKQEAQQIVSQLNPSLCRLKVGKSLFTSLGPEWVHQAQALGFDVFLDLKFHDIPFQVASSCRDAAQLGVWMMNVHALGGIKMMKAAREAIDSYHQKTNRRPLLIGVTLLTSHSEEDLKEIGLSGTLNENVLRLAGNCYEAGLDGVVCSAQEASQIKATFGKEFLCVTPGIRLKDQNRHDQIRVLTPVDAVNAGSDYLVMGRAILESSNPNQVLPHIIEDINNELV